MTSSLARTRRPRAVRSPPPPTIPTSVALASRNYIRLNIHDCHSSCCSCNIHHAGNGSLGMQRQVLGRSFSCNTFANDADALQGLEEKHTHAHFLLSISFTHLLTLSPILLLTHPLTQSTCHRQIESLIERCCELRLTAEGHEKL